MTSSAIFDTAPEQIASAAAERRGADPVARARTSPATTSPSRAATEAATAVPRAERRQRPGGAAELQGEIVDRFGEQLAVPRRRRPASRPPCRPKVVGTACWSSVRAGHRRRPVALGECGASGAHPIELGDHERPASLETSTQRGVERCPGWWRRGGPAPARLSGVARGAPRPAAPPGCRHLRRRRRSRSRSRASTSQAAAIALGRARPGSRRCAASRGASAASKSSIAPATAPVGRRHAQRLGYGQRIEQVGAHRRPLRASRNDGLELALEVDVEAQRLAVRLRDEQLAGGRARCARARDRRRAPARRRGSRSG